jgi:dienelactone hydrolase
LTAQRRLSIASFTFVTFTPNASTQLTSNHLFNMSAPCPDCFSGHVHTEVPTGTITTIHGLPTYVAQPEAGVEPKGIVVIITDAFGWDFVNNRILSDHYAKKGGFLVYCPDFMNGSYPNSILSNLLTHLAGHAMDISAMALFAAITTPASWFTTIFYKPFLVLKAMATAIPYVIRTRRSICKPRIFSFFQALRTSAPPFPTNNLKIGTAGFCWGGQYVVMLAHDTPSSRVTRHSSQLSSSTIEPLIDCGFTAHPSMLSVPNDIEKIKVPISVAVGDTDMAMKAPLIQQMNEILTVKMKGDHEVNIMPGAKHGFAIRHEPDDKKQTEFAEEAETQAVGWFTRWFT